MVNFRDPYQQSERRKKLGAPTPLLFLDTIKHNGPTSVSSFLKLLSGKLMWEQCLKRAYEHTQTYKAVREKRQRAALDMCSEHFSSYCELRCNSATVTPPPHTHTHPICYSVEILHL